MNVELIDVLGSDLSVVRAARVSYDGDPGAFDPDRDPKLIKYLLSHGHWSPFEHASLTVHVEAPIFIARQWMRHKSHAFNEVSGRYTELPDVAWYPGTWRKQAASNRQSSEGEVESQAAADEIYAEAVYAAWIAYRKLLKRGVCREQARAVLPLGTYTRFYDTMNLRSALHFLAERDHPDAQEEIRTLARQLRDIVAEYFPHTLAAASELA